MQAHWSLPRWNLLMLVAGIVAVAAGAFSAGRAQARGVPSTGALTYAGRLEDTNGSPLTGKHSIQVSLWTSATATSGSLCQTASSPSELIGGRFSVTLPEECTKGLKDNGPEVWVEVMVDGVPLERSKLGAVPFALAADGASRAEGDLAQQIVPSGAVLAFDLAQCPLGWSEFTPARGRAVIGLDSGLTRGTPVGSNSVVLTPDQMPSHAHPGTTGSGNATSYRTVGLVGTSHLANHNTGWSGTSNYTDSNDANWPLSNHTHSFSTDSVGGGQAFDNRQASLPLLFCKKD